MQHHRRRLGAIGGDVFETEALRHGAIDLHRRQRPGALQDIAEIETDLRAVESPFARQELHRKARAFETAPQRRLPRHPTARSGPGTSPAGSAGLLRCGRSQILCRLLWSSPRIAQARRPIAPACSKYARRPERTIAPGSEPESTPERLEAMQAAEIGEANRQIAIGVLARAQTDSNGPGSSSASRRYSPSSHVHQEHVVVKRLVVPRGFPQIASCRISGVITSVVAVALV